MTKTKRLLSFMLALIMIASILPASVVAAGTEYTGVEVRMQSVSPSDAIKDANLLLKAASDPNAATFESTPAIDMQYEWYYCYHFEWDIPEDERQDYELFIYNDEAESSAYIKKITDTNEYFDVNKKYMCLVTLTPKSGYAFAENCVVSPNDMPVQEVSTGKIVIAMSVYPEETTNTVDALLFKCTPAGVVHIDPAPDDYIYVAKATDGGYDELAYNNPVGQPVGTASINNAEYTTIYNPINLTNAPQIQLVMVSQFEWENCNTSAVYGYGNYLIPMSAPYATIDTVEFGQPVEIAEVGSTAIGKYSYNIANATFDGWYVDADGTIPATVDGEAYMVFTFNSNSGFDKDITAASFMLKCDGAAYNGAKIIDNTNETSKRVSFLIPSDRITVAVSIRTEDGSDGGYAFVYTGGFNEIYTDRTVTSLAIAQNPNRPTKPYGEFGCHMYINEGYFIRSIYINGEDWTYDNDSPCSENDSKKAAYEMPESGGYESSFRYAPTGNTVIEITLAKCDIITIDYSGFIANTVYDEFDWHSSGKYYVAEGYVTPLCFDGAIRATEPTKQQMVGLNTKPDGTGYSVAWVNDYFWWLSGDFKWNPGNPYENGVVDEITLYPIMMCEAHITDVNDNNWEYFDEVPATCESDGNVEYRYCRYCNRYQVPGEDGKYHTLNKDWSCQYVTHEDVIIPQLEHNHTQYQDNDDGTHSVQCEYCTDTKIEEHTYENDICICGAQKYIKGDVNNDGIVDDADVEYLLYYTIFPDEWPVNQPIDFNGDGAEDDADAEYLLYYTIFPEDNPLN